ncbi:hypothetical protein P9597_28020 [Aneurinibacillus migulanus]|uniref:hypothetical protein n=1 Tax=Aneurinibacillus migulanus TaxID=47500 RepID=UPI002E1D4976|nr:hypothetical protein [Aneurinibacillus migulanus]
MDMPCAPAEKGGRVFFQPLIFSFFSYLLPQEFVDVSNQMYIIQKAKRTFLEYTQFDVEGLLIGFNRLTEYKKNSRVCHVLHKQEGKVGWCQAMAQAITLVVLIQICCASNVWYTPREFFK